MRACERTDGLHPEGERWVEGAQIAVELDDGHWLRVIANDVGVRSAGRQRVNADVNVGETQNGGKRRCRANARRAIVATALRTGPCGALARLLLSETLSAFCGVCSRSGGRSRDGHRRHRRLEPPHSRTARARPRERRCLPGRRCHHRLCRSTAVPIVRATPRWAAHRIGSVSHPGTARMLNHLM